MELESTTDGLSKTNRNNSKVRNQSDLLWSPSLETPNDKSKWFSSPTNVMNYLRNQSNYSNHLLETPSKISNERITPELNSSTSPILFPNSLHHSDNRISNKRKKSNSSAKLISDSTSRSEPSKNYFYSVSIYTIKLNNCTEATKKSNQSSSVGITRKQKFENALLDDHSIMSRYEKFHGSLGTKNPNQSIFEVAKEQSKSRKPKLVLSETTNLPVRIDTKLSGYSFQTPSDEEVQCVNDTPKYYHQLKSYVNSPASIASNVLNMSLLLVMTETCDWIMTVITKQVVDSIQTQIQCDGQPKQQNDGDLTNDCVKNESNTQMCSADYEEDPAAPKIGDNSHLQSFKTPIRSGFTSRKEKFLNSQIKNPDAEFTPKLLKWSEFPSTPKTTDKRQAVFLKTFAQVPPKLHQTPKVNRTNYHSGLKVSSPFKIVPTTSTKSQSITTTSSSTSSLSYPLQLKPNYSKSFDIISQVTSFLLTDRYWKNHRLSGVLLRLN
ncbi:hypothetical protein HDV02_006604 [Globomyces sp. JEL0801]|nr:hypothetical protein HDV02_006604 [Globomyces sp. JEL0801]